MRRKIIDWWGGLTWTSTWTTTKDVGRRSWSATKRLPWRHILSLAWLAPALEKLVSIVLKLGTLTLVMVFLIFFIRLFKDQGYVIQEFSVPKRLEEQGYNGGVMAMRLQDEVAMLKEIAASVKVDSLELKRGGDDIDLSVLGVGLSLRTLAFQMREVLGRKNQIVSGQITRIDDRYEAELRMTDFPKLTVTAKVEPGREAAALDRLFRQLAEGVLFRTDPYRLALLLRKEGRYDEAIATVRHMLRTGDAEAHWAYLAWGILLTERKDDAGAIEKFEKAIALVPDFPLPYVNAAYAHVRQGRVDEGITNFRKALALESDNAERINSLAWILHNAEYYSTADSLYRSNLSGKHLDDKARDMLALSWAEMHFQREDIAGAKRILEEYVRQDGENVYSYLIEGVTAFAEQDTTIAFGYLKDAYELDPASEAAINASLGFAQMVGDYDHVLHVYHTADWSVVGNWQKANTFNQIAMYFNRMERHDSARVAVDRAIAVDTLEAYPYTTLAETFYFQGQIDSFYYYTEKALRLGFNPRFFDYSAPPYDTVGNHLRFQQLLRTYRKAGEEPLSG